jgi:hypothetical protein
MRIKPQRRPLRRYCFQFRHPERRRWFSKKSTVILSEGEREVHFTNKSSPSRSRRTLVVLSEGNRHQDRDPVQGKAAKRSLVTRFLSAFDHQEDKSRRVLRLRPVPSRHGGTGQDSAQDDGILKRSFRRGLLVTNFTALRRSSNTLKFEEKPLRAPGKTCNHQASL